MRPYEPRGGTKPGGRLPRGTPARPASSHFAPSLSFSVIRAISRARLHAYFGGRMRGPHIALVLVLSAGILPAQATEIHDAARDGRLDEPTELIRGDHGLVRMAATSST